MTKASDNIFPKVTFVEGSAPSSPSASDFHLYFDSSDHALKWKNSAGTVTTVATGSGATSGMSYVQIYIPASNPTSLTGAWTIVEYTDIPTAATTAYRGMSYQSSGTQNDEISFDLYMDAGTYTFHVLGRKSSNTGIITINIDAVSAGTIDTYAAAPALLSSTLTSVSISAGKRTIQLKMATKNASSSGYYGELMQLIIQRTA